MPEIPFPYKSEHMRKAQDDEMTYVEKKALTNRHREHILFPKHKYFPKDMMKFPSLGP